MKNKLTDNDPRLTAYALGELSRDEAEEIARILEAPFSGPLVREVESIDALGIKLTQALGSGGAEDLKLKLSPRQRDAIFRSAKAPTADDVESTRQSTWIRPVIVILSAAALVTFSFLALYNMDSDENAVARMPEVSFSEYSDDEMHAPIQPSNADWNGARDVSSRGVVSADHAVVSRGLSAGSDASGLVQLVENEWVERASDAVTRMPLACGKASWKWVKNSIEKDGVLPNKNAVRVEEILNAFSYDEPSDLELSHAAAGVELVRCPWNDGHMIAVILLENKHSGNTQVEAALTFSESVEKYRLVGYAKGEAEKDNLISPAKITMGVGDAHIVIYEIDTVADIETAMDVISLSVRTSVLDDEWITDEKTLNVQFSDRAWTKSKQDVKFALILASWSQILSESSYDADMNKDKMAEMVNEFEADHTLTDKQAEVVKIIRRSLDLIKL